MQMLLIKTYRFMGPRKRNNEGSDAPVLSPDEARQGVISGRVALVLIVSLTLAVFAGAMLVALHMFPI